MSQNLLSFNISTTNSKTLQKIQAITKEKNDIVFVSDTRLNSYVQNYAIHDLEKKFNFKGYDFIHNSKRASRGTGILISKRLSYVINGQTNDYEDNYLLLDITILNFRMVLGSIYGPNCNNQLFWENLRNDLKNLNCNHIILGGDWNATWDCSNSQENCDVINMVNIPSRFRSEQIRVLCNENHLVEPFRNLNPDKTDFTYIPNAQNNTNRSRIDFFLISNVLINKCKNSYISNSLLSNLFDHKAVYLDFKKKVKKSKDKIKDTILKNELLQHHVKACVWTVTLTTAPQLYSLTLIISRYLRGT